MIVINKNRNSFWKFYI